MDEITFGNEWKDWGEKELKVVINKCYGGFGITDECLKLYNKLSGKKLERYYDIQRHNPNLIKAIEQLGENESSGECAELKIVEIPNGKEYTIDEYDGMETIHEKVEEWG